MISAKLSHCLRSAAARAAVKGNYKAVFLSRGGVSRSFGVFTKKSEATNDEEMLNDSKMLMETSVRGQLVHEPYQRRVGTWLLIVAGTIFAMVVLGGYTRLTKSGLSMTRWKPVQRVWPQTPEAWEEEFSHYRVEVANLGVSRVPTDRA